MTDLNLICATTSAGQASFENPLYDIMADNTGTGLVGLYDTVDGHSIHTGSQVTTFYFACPLLKQYPD